MIFRNKWAISLSEDDRPTEFFEFMAKFQALQEEYGYVFSHPEGHEQFELWTGIPTDDHFKWQMEALVCRHTTPLERATMIAEELELPD